jgi:hypothetical protein
MERLLATLLKVVVVLVLVVVVVVRRMLGLWFGFFFESIHRSTNSCDLSSINHESNVFDAEVSPATFSVQRPRNVRLSISIRCPSFEWGGLASLAGSLSCLKCSRR